MKHVAHESLWALAHDTCTPAERADAEAHLAGCARCAAALEDVRAAQGVLAALPAPPPMPDGVARRVGARLAQDVGPQPSWLEALWPRRAAGWALAAAVAVVVAIGVASVALRSAPPAAPVAELKAPPAPAPLEPPPVVMPPPSAPPLPTRPLVARVTRVKRGDGTGSAVATNDALEAGRQLQTAAGGAVDVALPDGSQLNVGARTRLGVAALTERRLAFTLDQGTVSLEVPHREDRELVVQAGAVTVTDLGTRFAVTSEAGRVLVWVDEGEVDVAANGEHHVLTAGRQASYAQGRWKLGPAAAPGRATPTPAPAAGEPPSTDSSPAAAKLTGDDELAAAQTPSPAPGPAPEADEDWTVPEAIKAQRAPKKQGASSFGIEGLEGQLGQAAAEARGAQPFRQGQARIVAQLADAGRCEAALAEATRFLRGPKAPGPIEVPALKMVLQAKVRCLTKLGRAAEAAVAQQEHDALR